jgi:Flp pilus assembly pilin Flp
MNKFKSFSKRLLKNTKGQGMVEYILLLVVVVAIVFAMKGKLTQYVEGDMFKSLQDKVSGVMNQ